MKSIMDVVRPDSWRIVAPSRSTCSMRRRASASGFGLYFFAISTLPSDMVSPHVLDKHRRTPDPAPVSGIIP